MVQIERLIKMTIRPTSQCDRRCSDCYDDSVMSNYPIELSDDQEDALTSEVEALAARKIGKILIHFTGGGEPLLKNSLPRTVNRMLAVGAYVSVITSGCKSDEDNRIDLANLESLASIRDEKFQPVLSTKISMPGWKERFRFTVGKLAAVNHLVKVRQTSYGPKSDAQFEELLENLGYSQIDREDIAQPMPPGFYRRDLIVAGQTPRQTLYSDNETVLQVLSHNVMRAGRGKLSDRETNTDTVDCPMLNHPKPYVDIWPNGLIYPCFIIGPEIPELSLGRLGQISIEKALHDDDLEARKKIFSQGVKGDFMCDKCRDGTNGSNMKK